MISVDPITISPSEKVRVAMAYLNNPLARIVLVVDQNHKLLGTITDGDIRRGLLAGISLDDASEKIMHENPIAAKHSDNVETIQYLANQHQVNQVVIVDNDNCVVDLKILKHIVETTCFDNPVVLMAGGLGERLRPLTEKTPKPLLKVGDKPILQTIIERFVFYGFKNIFISVNYKAHMIQDYFGNGEAVGANIQYISEKIKRGTVGALDLLRDTLKQPFFVMNADLLTNVNFKGLMEYHVLHDAFFTVCVREYEMVMPFGVIERNDHQVKRIDEKPLHRFDVNAGIYVLNPDVLDYLPKGRYVDMPELINGVLSANKKVVSFPIGEYWLDIGHETEYKQANREYTNVF